MKSEGCTYLSTKLVANKEAIFDLYDSNEAVWIEFIELIFIYSTLHVVLIHYLGNFLLQLQLTTN